MKTYQEGLRDAYRDILHLITADGYNAAQLAKLITKTLED